MIVSDSTGASLRVLSQSIRTSSSTILLLPPSSLRLLKYPTSVMYGSAGLFLFALPPSRSYAVAVALRSASELIRRMTFRLLPCAATPRYKRAGDFVAGCTSAKKEFLLSGPGGGNTATALRSKIARIWRSARLTVAVLAITFGRMYFRLSCASTVHRWLFHKRLRLFREARR